MRGFLTVAAALALLTPTVVDAQAGKARPKAAAAKPAAARPAAARPTPARGGREPTRAELAQANDVLSLFVSAFNSKDVPDPTKAGLLMCLYANPLGGIAASHAKAMAENKAIDAKSPVQKLLVLTVLCKAPLPSPDATDKPARAVEKGR